MRALSASNTSKTTPRSTSRTRRLHFPSSAWTITPIREPSREMQISSMLRNGGKRMSRRKVRVSRSTVRTSGVNQFLTAWANRLPSAERRNELSAAGSIPMSLPLGSTSNVSTGPGSSGRSRMATREVVHSMVR